MPYMNVSVKKMRKRMQIKYITCIGIAKVPCQSQTSVDSNV